MAHRGEPSSRPIRSDGGSRRPGRTPACRDLGVTTFSYTDAVCLRGSGVRPRCASSVVEGRSGAHESVNRCIRECNGVRTVQSSCLVVRGGGRCRRGDRNSVFVGTATPTYSDKVASNVGFDDLLRPAISVTGFAGAPLTDRAAGVQPGAPLKVTAQSGTLTDVRIPKADGGGTVAGAFNADRTTWTSTEPLGYGTPRTRCPPTPAASPAPPRRRCRSHALAEQPHRRVPAAENNSTVGIGQPVAIRFDEPITDRKAAPGRDHGRTDPPVEARSTGSATASSAGGRRTSGSRAPRSTST